MAGFAVSSALSPQQYLDKRIDAGRNLMAAGNTHDIVRSECNLVNQQIIGSAANTFKLPKSINKIEIRSSISDLKAAYDETLSILTNLNKNFAKKIALGGLLSSDTRFQTTFYTSSGDFKSSLSPYHEFGHVAYACLDPLAEERYLQILKGQMPNTNDKKFLGIGDEYAAICLSYLGHMKAADKEWDHLINSVDKTQYEKAYKNVISPNIGLYNPNDERISQDSETFNKLVLIGIRSLRRTQSLRSTLQTIYKKIYGPIYRQIEEVMDNNSDTHSCTFTLTFGNGLTSVATK